MGEPGETGTLAAYAGRWYFVLFRVGGSGESVIHIGERDDRGRNREWRQAMPSNWANLKWDVSLDGYAGRLSVDRYEQLALYEPPG